MSNRTTNAMGVLTAALLMGALFTGVPAAAHADRYKECSHEAQQNLDKVVGFLSKNMSQIVDQLTFLTEKQRQEIVRKWPKVKIRCNDDSRRCRAKNGIGIKGHAHGGLGNTVNLCQANMVDTGYSVCDAVSTLMHEMGHAHGFRMVPGHNDPNDYVYKHDPIYRMGSIAGAYCVTAAKAGDVVDAPFKGATRAALGDGCRNNSDCSSGRCWVKLDSSPFEVTPPGIDRGKCVCNDDGDCAGAQQCFKPLGKEPYCSSTTKKLGESCKKNSQCASDKCERDECVCRKNTDCGPNGKCRTPITGKNYCE